MREERVIYNRIWMTRKRAQTRTAKLINEGKCPKCEMILAMDQYHDCGRSFMPGWTEIVNEYREWDRYFHYYEKEGEHGSTLFNRKARKEYLYLENFHGTLDQLRETIRRHEELSTQQF